MAPVDTGQVQADRPRPLTEGGRSEQFFRQGSDPVGFIPDNAGQPVQAVDDVRIVGVCQMRQQFVPDAVSTVAQIPVGGVGEVGRNPWT